MSRPPSWAEPGGRGALLGSGTAAWPDDGNPSRASGTTVSLFATETRENLP